MWQENIVLSTVEFEHRVRTKECICMSCGNIQDALDDECGVCNSTHLLSVAEAASIGIVVVDEEQEVA